MFREQARHARDAGALRKVVQWSVALAQGDGLVVAGERGKQIAEAPDAALIDRRLGKATLAPGGFQVLRFAARLPSSEDT